MVQENTWFKCDDRTKLYLHRWKPVSPTNEKPIAVLHIVHGMAEHGGRYGRLAEKLCSAGIEVWAADQRGHGKTADLSVNAPGSGGLLGYSADKNTFDKVTADIHSLNKEIKNKLPGVPLFLLGHSWGSFIAQNYIETHFESKDIDGCILSGTSGPGGFKVKAGKVFMSLLAAFGKRRKSPLAKALADGPYNNAFRPNRTPFDWLSRDEAEVDAYCRDPLCGNLCSVGFYRDLAKGLYEIHRDEAMAKIRKCLPMYVFCGNTDPVGDMGAGPALLVSRYRSIGVQDIEFVLYPGARHELLNETNREEVIDNLLSWILRHAASEQTINSTEKD